jgi:hypothetical protein
VQYRYIASAIDILSITTKQRIAHIYIQACHGQQQQQQHGKQRLTE